MQTQRTHCGQSGKERMGWIEKVELAHALPGVK